MHKARQLIREALRAGATALSEYDSKRLLAAYGLPVVQERLACTPEAALAAAADLGYPVALKACSAALSHKTEGGLVELGITDPASLRRVAVGLQARAPAGSALLVQQMVAGRRELVVGLVRDPGLGPVVMLGLGGIFAEALADVSYRMAPLAAADVAPMVAQLAGWRIFGPYRGMPAVDIEALAAWLIGLGQIGLQHPEVQQLDVNPLIVCGSQPVAVDALVVLAGTPAASGGSGAPLGAPAAKGHRGRHARPRRSLRPLLAPRTVAVIGASATPGKPGYEVVRNIEAQGFRGRIYLVNPRGGLIRGRPVAASIAELPRNIDLGIVVLPAGAVAQAVRELGARGVRAVVLAAGGFAELDRNGATLQVELERAVQETGIRALGPNTSGHVSTPARCTSSFFPLGTVPRGPISYIAQTGNFATHSLRYIMSHESFGVAQIIGVGNKVDVEESEVLEYLGADADTQAIFVYLESLARPRRFVDVAREVTRRKPVVMLKGGTTAEGARAALAHTAALATDDRLLDGVLRQAGVVRIRRYSHLVLAAKALAFMPLPRGNRVGFAAPSGGMLVCLTDLCRRSLQLQVPDVAEATRQRLQDLSPPLVRLRNPVDIWPAATLHGPHRAYAEGVEALLGDPNIDAVVVILMLTEPTGAFAVDFLVELAGQHPDKPVYVSFTGDQALMAAAKAYLEPRGVPTFPLIEDPFEVLDIAWRCSQARAPGPPPGGSPGPRQV
jgi:acyl-CoA synthetase (NDP forming)